MDFSSKKFGLGDTFKNELPISNSCLAELRTLQAELARVQQGRFEIFDFGLVAGHRSEEATEKSLGRLTQACIWNSIALKAEFKLKLLYTINGYVSAVDAQNPVSTFLLARYLLELVATISSIDFDLYQCVAIDLVDWNHRATKFLATLYRARHSTTDERFKSTFVRLGIEADLVKPIKISNAIKRLAARPGFEFAVTKYHSLSNLCHHNGSGHKMLADGIQLTNAIATRNGHAIFLSEKVAAVTMSYPSEHFSSTSLALTARVAWWSARCANEIIDELLETPFTDKELAVVSNGRITSARSFFDNSEPQTGKNGRAKTPTARRNALCSCGSGKKFKHCCLVQR